MTIPSGRKEAGGVGRGTRRPARTDRKMLVDEEKQDGGGWERGEGKGDARRRGHPKAVPCDERIARRPCRRAEPPPTPRPTRTSSEETPTPVSSRAATGKGIVARAVRRGTCCAGRMSPGPFRRRIPGRCPGAHEASTPAEEGGITRAASTPRPRDDAPTRLQREDPRGFYRRARAPGAVSCT